MPVINNIPTTQYIGPKIIPHLWDPILWDSTIQYDALAVVQYNGAGYISRFIPPIGTNPSDTEYWVKWSDFNAQLAQVQQQVQSLANSIDDKVSETDFQNAVDDINAAIAEKADITSVDAVQSQIDTINDDIDTLSEKAFAFTGISNSSPFENLQQLYEVFLSWKAHQSSLYYGAPSLFSLDHNEDFSYFAPRNLRKTLVDGTYKNAMSCSVLTLCALLGITFERSRYATGTEQIIEGDVFTVGGTNTPLSGSGQFIDFTCKTATNYWQRYADMSIDTASNAFYSDGLAHWLYDCGLLIPCTVNELAYKAMPGDIIFYKDAEPNPDYYKWDNLGHTDIFMGWNGQSYNVLTSSGSANVVNFTHRSLLDPVATRIAWIARIPSAVKSPDAINMIDGATHSTALTFDGEGVHTFARIEFNNSAFLAGTGLHTAVVKVNSVHGENVRLNIYGARLTDQTNVTSQRGTIYFNNEGCYIGQNCYYCIFDERYMWNSDIATDIGGIRCTTNADGQYDIDIEEIRFYNYPIQPRPF